MYELVTIQIRQKSNLVHAQLDTSFLLAVTINYQHEYEYDETKAFQKSLCKHLF